MAGKIPSPGKNDIGRAARFAGLSVHALTASGAVLGFLALLAAIEGRYTIMFWWLVLALIVDAVDGSFARRADVSRTAPEVSGEILDLVVDYVTYVLVPALAMYRAGLLPDTFALPGTALILITSAFYFADVRMKTQDWYFRGFPAVWNLFAFLAFVWSPNAWGVFAAVVIFSVLTFSPVAFVHPVRVQRLRMFNLVMLGATGVLCVLALWWQLAPPAPVKIGLAVAALYFLLIGLFRQKA